MRMIVLLIVCLPVAASAGTTISAGYQEAVFSVSDIESWATFFEEEAGWAVIHDGDIDDALLAGWELPKTAAARELLVGNPGTERGFVRLVQFDGVPQKQIRSNAQSWDTGGFFDVNLRVLNMEQKFADLQRRGWQAAADPVKFSFGPFVVNEWLARGPDGIVIALIERLQPPLEGNPHLRDMGRLINATQVVADIDAAREFYKNDLGFETYLDHSGPSKQEGPNVLGLPHNLTATIPRHVSILHPQGTNEGSVELLQFEGATGSDYSTLASPPNLGVLMLRFPVHDISEFAAHVESRNLKVAMPITAATVPPYGRAKLMAIRGPGGVWLEFFELHEEE